MPVRFEDVLRASSSPGRSVDGLQLPTKPGLYAIWGDETGLEKAGPGLTDGCPTPISERLSGVSPGVTYAHISPDFAEAESGPKVSAILSAIRTTLDLDDNLIAALMARYPDSSRTEAIERAVEAYLRDDAKRRLLDLAGTIEIDDVTPDRRYDRHT